jgi:aspartyl aminopeptidase
VNDEGLKLNAQTQLPALFALGSEGDPLRGLLGDELGCDPKDILTWDLCLFDLTRPALGGLNQEFVFSGRLDNLGSSHAALEAMLRATSGTLPDSTAIIALFDHEEVGSTTARGANGKLLGNLLERLERDTTARAEGGLPRAIAHSWHMSADMAHAVHPGWADRHDAQHMPMIGAGPVIKQNASQRYGTEAETAALLVRLFEAAEVEHQWFVNRSDLACGTTVGPLVAAELGIRTADVGNPMLSMHSAREMAGAADHGGMVSAMATLLGGFGS